MSVTKKVFGKTIDGKEVTLFHIENSRKEYAEVINYGAILVKLCVHDKNGGMRDVVLGYDRVEDYEENPCFFGAVIGRNGNRIADAQFEIQGKVYHLTPNENENNLHSGPDGFERKLWDAEVDEERNRVLFSRISPDGENGFPGEMKVCAAYEFTEDSEIKISYEAVSDKDTIANFTNHSYFNLNGEGSGKVLEQNLQILADQYTPVQDSKSIPTGENASVKGTPMDFTESRKIGAEIEADFAQLAYTGGYDHNYVTNGYRKGVVREIASAYSEESGIHMTVTSDRPGVQFYAGNFIGERAGKNGHIYTNRDGFCLETQVEPNAVNVEGFYSPVLKAGETFTSETGYRFYTDK